MSSDKSMHNLAIRDRKAAEKRYQTEKQRAHEKAMRDAHQRRERLIARAVQFGANRTEPMYVLCAIAHYRVRPVVFGNQLVIDIAKNKRGIRYIGPRSRVIGEIHFLPAGGIAGVKVVDSAGELMICDGTCVPDKRWSVFTRGFHLLDTDEKQLKDA